MSEINGEDIDRVNAMIERVRDAGLEEEATVFANSYWGWIRISESYRCAHPYVSKPDIGMTPISALTVVDYTFSHWASLIPGSAKLDDAAVRNEADLDEFWHKEEDKRMRREAGELG